MLAKWLFAFGAVAVLSGCGNPEMLSDADIRWEGPASEYLNKNRDKPHGAVSDWKVEVKKESGIRMVRYFVNGKKTGELVCNPTNGVDKRGTICEVVLSNPVIAVHWTEDDGYRVGTSSKPKIGDMDNDIKGEKAEEFLSRVRPFFRKVGVAF